MKAVPCLAALILLMALPLAAQRSRKPDRVGLPEDWSHHHVVFGGGAAVSHTAARRVLSDPRFLHQELHRAARAHTPGHDHGNNGKKRRVDWSVNLGGAGSRLATGTFPAKYTFNINATPDCTSDFAVFALNIAGSAGQATIVAYNNLYSGTGPTGPCGTAPSVKWAYNTGGAINTSPVLSLDGNKVAWVAGMGSPVLHVLTIGTSGSNGTAVNSPAVPGTGNNATDVQVAFGSTGDTRSSLFVDYSNDVGYVASDDGDIHKFTGIFGGTPTEVIDTNWPFQGADGANHVLTSVVYDSVSGNLFYASDAGTLAYIREAGSTRGACANLGGSPPCLGLNTYSFAAPIADAPLIDVVAQTVFVFAGSGVQQTDTQLSTNGPQAKIGPAATIAAPTTGASRSSNVVTITTTAAHGFSAGQRVTVAGVTDLSFNGTFVIASTPTTTTFTYAQTGSNATSGNGFAWTNSTPQIFDGSFDNNYYISPSSGFLYVCGNATSGTVAPRLFQIGFNGSNVMNTAPGASTLALSSVTTTCSPMTEVFNPPTLKDWLFVGVADGCTATGGGSTGCVMSLDVTSGFPGAATQGRPAMNGTSGIVVDNVSTSSQASSIYFSSQGDSVCGDGSTSGCAVKMTQSGLN